MSSSTEATSATTTTAVKKICKAGDFEKITPDTLAEYNEQLKTGFWEYPVDCQSKLKAVIKTRDFMHAVDYINAIAIIAEKFNHHPDIHLTNYRQLTIELYTFATAGLTTLDYEVAKEIQDIQL